MMRRFFLRRSRASAASSKAGAATISRKNPARCSAACASSRPSTAMIPRFADPVPAYGGIIAVDGRLDAQAAEHLAGFFLEIVAAPAFDEAAPARLRRK